MRVRLKVNTAFGTPEGTPGVISSLSPWFTIMAATGEILCCEHEVSVTRAKTRSSQETT
jgi:hypothetical protein